MYHCNVILILSVFVPKKINAESKLFLCSLMPSYSGYISCADLVCIIEVNMGLLYPSEASHGHFGLAFTTLPLEHLSEIMDWESFDVVRFAL